MDDHAISTKLIYVGKDGATVMQGNKNGLCVHIQTQVAPYMIQMHGMTDKMNLACQIISKFDNIMKVEDVVDEIIEENP